jgi:RNA polymerase sigma-70 factor (sigma-E family)
VFNSDDELIGGLVTFDEFAAGYLPGLLRFAAVLTGDRASAEDVVQDVLVRAHARWNRIGALDRPEFYVRKMVLNEFLSARRRQRLFVLGGSAADVDTRTAPDWAASHADRDALLAELARLPARQRAVIVLRYYEGLPDAEIADLLGVAPTTVRGYAHRALTALRIELAGHSTGPGNTATTVRLPVGKGADHED